MQSLLDLSLRETLSKLSLKEAVSFLKGDGSIFQESEQMLNTKEGILKLISLCNIAQKEMIVNSVRGRFDLESKEEWSSHLLALSEGKVFEYGYKYKGLFYRDHIDTDDPMEHDPDDCIMTNESYSLNPGLIVVPLDQLKEKKLYQTLTPGLLPKEDTIGVHIEASVIFAKYIYLEEERYRYVNYWNCLSEGKEVLPEHELESLIETQGKKKFDLVFWLSCVTNEQNVVIEFLNIILEHVRENYESLLVPKDCTYERWDDYGTWEDRDSQDMTGWENFSKNISPLVRNGILFANPGCDFERKDINQITVLMGDELSMFQIGFNCTKIKLSN